MAKVKPIPAGYHNVTPYLIVDGAARAIDFYKKVFGATEKMRMPGPGGKVGHAELTLGDSMIMLADEHPETGARAPSAYGGSAVSLMVYVPDVGRHCGDRNRRRRNDPPSGRESVLRRPDGHDRGSLRAPVARRHARRGRPA